MDESIIEKYSISEEQKEKIFQNIMKDLTLNIKPVKNPIAIIVGGQTGAGKSGLMSYTHKMFKSEPFQSFEGQNLQEDWIPNNFIQIEDDEFRAYFPDEKTIAIEHPEEYIQITNKLTNELTAKIFDYLSKNSYNIIFHQTLKNNRIADDGIIKLKNLGYAIVVRALAVNELESRMSMIERSLGQIKKKGYCRNVTTSDHDKTYFGMPDTLEYIENNGRYDILQVLKRGKENNEPIMVYSKINPDSQKLELLSTFPYLLTFDLNFGYKSAKEALLKTRELGKEPFLKNAEIRLGDAKSEKGNSVISSQIVELENKIAQLSKETY